MFNLCCYFYDLKDIYFNLSTCMSNLALYMDGKPCTPTEKAPQRMMRAHHRHAHLWQTIRTGCMLLDKGFMPEDQLYIKIKVLYA